MDNANFDKAVCALCDKNKRERCMMFRGKGSCKKDCRFAYNHKKMPDSAVTVVYDYISDGCRWGAGRRQFQHKKIVAVPVLPPATPRVLPVVPEVTVPVLSNISSESKLYNSTLDLGKLSPLSCSNLSINKYTVPCVVSCQPSLLSPTAETYVYHVAKSPVSTLRPTFITPVAEPPVITPPAFDDLNVAVAKSSALPIAVAESSAPLVSVAINLSSSAKPFVLKLFHLQ